MPERVVLPGNTRLLYIQMPKRSSALVPAANATLAKQETQAARGRVSLRPAEG